MDGTSRIPFTHRPSGPRLWVTTLLAALALLPGCGADSSIPTESIAPGLAPTEVRLDCVVTVADARMECSPPVPDPGAASASASITLGWEHVELKSRDARYDDSAYFSVDVRLRGLIQQAIGTLDGTTAAPRGIRVFFHSGPTATRGFGMVEVANASGRAIFTNVDQPYLQYDTLLKPGEWSDWKVWIFSCPPTVQAFSFIVYVSAPVQHPGGWITLAPTLVDLVPARAVQLYPSVYQRSGASTSQPLTWTSSDSSVATVRDGLVRGVAPGSAVITAAADYPWRTPARAAVVVSAVDTLGPRLELLTVTPAPADVSRTPVPTVTFEVHGIDANDIPAASIHLTSPDGAVEKTCVTSAIRGAPGHRWRRCDLPLEATTRTGAWPLTLRMSDSAGNVTVLDAPALAARGQPSALTVVFTRDTIFPRLLSFSFEPDTVILAGSSGAITFSLHAADAESGVHGGEVRVSHPAHPDYPDRTQCSLARVSGTAADGTWSCQANILRAGRPGVWTVERVDLVDHDVRTILTTAQLEAAGHPTRFVVVRNDSVDVQPPEIVNFTITPDTVGPTGMVTFSLTLRDVAGAGSTLVELAPLQGPAYRDCAMVLEEGTVHDGTWRCTVPVRSVSGDLSPGVWRVVRLWTLDVADNYRIVENEELRAAGFEDRFVVTP